MHSRVYKGEFGYIKYRKKVAIIRTAICLAIAVGLYVIGLVAYGSQKNILSIKAGFCSESDHDKIEAHKGGLLIHYDHVITSYETNYNVNASTVLDKNICMYTADKTMDVIDCEKHIKKMIAQSGYSSYSIKIFTDIDKFCDRLDQLEKLRKDKNINPKAIEDAWVPGTVQTPSGVLLSISL